MKYRRVITMLASASLAISIPVTSLAAEVNLVVPNKIGTSNHADTQGETDTTQEQEKVQTEPMIEEAQSETPSLEDSIPEHSTARSTRYSAIVTRDIFRGGRQYFAL